MPPNFIDKFKDHWPSDDFRRVAKSEPSRSRFAQGATNEIRGNLEREERECVTVAGLASNLHDQIVPLYGRRQAESSLTFQIGTQKGLLTRVSWE
jgi:hypothetical protein